jgi:uncharacterized protein
MKAKAAPRPKRKKTMPILSAVCLLALAYSFVEPFLLTDAVYDLTEGHRAGALKIVFLTDIHHGPFFSRARVGALVDRVNRMEPDIVLLGGDYVHRDGKYIQPVFSELKRLKAKYLVAGVLGNHDHQEGADASRAAMEAAGIRLLENSNAPLEIAGRRFRIFGVGDFLRGSQYIERGELEEGNATEILVSHNPDYVAELPPELLDRFTLILCGHTHGGQVSFFGLWAPIVPSAYGQRFRTGEKTLGRAKLIISNGIGTITPPLRFFVFPQICTVYL